MSGLVIENGWLVRWRLEDEQRVKACDECGGPILFGEVIEVADEKHPEGRPTRRRERWLPLDPDLMPHGCGSSRVVRRAEESDRKARRKETAA